jgi:hypothetical protein
MLGESIRMRATRRLDQLATASERGQERALVLNHLPTGPWPVVEPVRHYFDAV